MFLQSWRCQDLVWQDPNHLDATPRPTCTGPSWLVGLKGSGVNGPRPSGVLVGSMLTGLRAPSSLWLASYCCRRQYWAKGHGLGHDSDVSESACKIVTPSREQRGRHTFCQRYLIRRRALLPSPNVNRQAMSAIPEFCVPRRCGVCRFKLDYGETIIVGMLARCQFTYIKLLTRVPSKTKRYNSVKGAPISFLDARDIHALLGMPTLLAQ